MSLALASEPQTATTHAPQWLTVSDVMQRTKLSRTTLWTHMSSGRLKSKKVGGSRRIEESALAEFMASFDGNGEIDA